MKKILIVGATSGIGLHVAKLFIQAGWQVGIAGRRAQQLEELRLSAPSQVLTQQIDITQADASTHLLNLISRMDGIDIYLHCAGVGHQNLALQPEIELQTALTNVEGFTRMITVAYNYFVSRGAGHIAVISSIAGTKGLGAAPAYSATKRFQNTYIEALDQLAHLNHHNITFTDIRPGFVDTPLLRDHTYPMVMSVDKVARHIYKAVIKRKRIATIDASYRVLVFFWRLLPRSLWVRLPIKTRH